MITKDELREVVLAQKDSKGATWDQLGEAIGRSPVYAAMLAYGYGAATQSEADEFAKLLELPGEARDELMKVPHRTPAQEWPPTDPFIYRLYEVVLLLGPVLKDIAHEKFGDGIMSAIDMSVEVNKVKGEEGDDRAQIVLDGKWLTYKKF